MSSRLTSLHVCSAIALAVSAAGCGRVEPVRADAKLPNSAPAEPAPAPAGKRQVRATGTIQAVRAYTVQVPQIASSLPGQGNSKLTLVKLTPNGTIVKAGDVLAEFDRTLQIDAAREAKAKYEDLGHQVKEKAAKNGSDAAKRSSEMAQAVADQAKAEIQLKRGPVLAEIDRLKNEEKAANAKARVISLTKSDASRRVAEAAAVEILRLQQERQKVALDRAELNAQKLVLKASIGGMVALENLWRGGSMGNAQEGDQLWSGQPLMKIFDPSAMEVRTMIGEPDSVSLKQGSMATVYLDAYPDAVFRARFHSASPVATAALGSPIKNFTARFSIEASDRRLLPDLSAAVIVNGDGQ